MIIMFYVYVLKSQKYRELYTGYTKNLKTRLRDHNAGKSTHTKKYRPWTLVWYGAFDNEVTARNFEKYLKTGSGKAFLHKRLIRFEDFQ